MIRFAFMLLSTIAVSQTVWLEDFPTVIEISNWRDEYKHDSNSVCAMIHGHSHQRACAIRRDTI